MGAIRGLVLGTALALLAQRGDDRQAAGELVPAIPLDQPVTAATAGELLYFEADHALSVGDKGEDHYGVSTRPPACGATALVFDHARIVYVRRRFGEARIVSSPPAGCTYCAPLVVRWYHEPTGYLGYQVHVYRRRVEGRCPGDTPGGGLRPALPEGDPA